MSILPAGMCPDLDAAAWQRDMRARDHHMLPGMAARGVGQLIHSGAAGAAGAAGDDSSSSSSSAPPAFSGPSALVPTPPPPRGARLRAQFRADRERHAGGMDNLGAETDVLVAHSSMENHHAPRFLQNDIMTPKTTVHEASQSEGAYPDLLQQGSDYTIEAGDDSHRSYDPVLQRYPVVPSERPPADMPPVLALQRIKEARDRTGPVSLTGRRPPPRRSSVAERDPTGHVGHVIRQGDFFSPIKPQPKDFYHPSFRHRLRSSEGVRTYIQPELIEPPPAPPDKFSKRVFRRKQSDYNPIYQQFNAEEQEEAWQRMQGQEQEAAWARGQASQLAHEQTFNILTARDRVSGELVAEEYGTGVKQVEASAAQSTVAEVMG